MRDWTIPTALAATKAESMDRFVLAIVAGHWNATTRDARPGSRRVAELCGCSQSTASRHLARLQASGDLVVKVAGSGRRATRYRVPALESGPVAIHHDPIATDVSDPPMTDREVLDAWIASASESSRPRSDPQMSHPWRGSELGSEEVDLRARAREDDWVPPYLPSDEERDRVEGTLRALRDSLGFGRRSDDR